MGGTVLSYSGFSFDDACRWSNDKTPLFPSVDHLSLSLLVSLCKGDVLAIRVPGFSSAEVCRHISSNLEFSDGQAEHYDNAPELDIYRMGMSYFETRFNRSLLDPYFDNAPGCLSMLDSLCPGRESPLRSFIRLLEQVWPAGAAVQQLEGRSMRPGLVRVLLEGQSFSPHQDMLVRDIPGLPADDVPLAQLAVNIYMENFEEGGDLELWDCAPNDQEVLDLYNGKHDFIDRERLLPVGATLRPQVGELILCRSDKVHAVTAGYGGKRVSFSCFVAYRGMDQPLTYWI